MDILYNLDMKNRLSSSSARAQFADIVNRAAYGKERIVLHRRSRPVAAIVPIEDLQSIERIEDEIDIREGRKAMREKGKNIPLEELRKKLRL